MALGPPLARPFFQELPNGPGNQGQNRGLRVVECLEHRKHLGCGPDCQGLLSTRLRAAGLASTTVPVASVST